ncbi:hypothetical protein Tsubulata_039133 [Turnera subulata]|uniref:3'-5' exonuclease domain-containing protein n=1 Tax=Turnera subulata TaxID=218843 RepID=A0A9Q0F1A5_9ROSI|nr:hypothetical protein Tsubulata_039133 [Turnera subulata]
MGQEEEQQQRTTKPRTTPTTKNNNGNQRRDISVHSFADLTRMSPVVFLYLLKECYVHGKCKATKKFRALQQQVHQVLSNSPQPGPATFILQCLYVLPLFGFYSEGFSHLIISALGRFLKLATLSEDISNAKLLAAGLFIDTVVGSVDHDERVLVKILEVFGVRVVDVEEAFARSKVREDHGFDSGEDFIEKYILKLIESQSYMTAVQLLEHFAIRQSGESFLVKMMENHQSRAAEKWATFMGKAMLCVLVQEYVDRNMLKHACETIKKNDLQQDFPEVYHKCKESALKSLAEKALWDLAEAKTHGDRQLLEYLVYLAMEAGYTEKVEELSNRYSLEGFVKAIEPEACIPHGRFLEVNELAIEDIVWVDGADGLQNVTSYIEGCKVVGIDCEWKPNYVKGAKLNKVSIMQIASDKMVFILDLIKLFEDVPDILDNCLTRILQSHRILKLGYNFQCDVKQLAHSYVELECFKHYEMLLDIQNVFKEPRGGLSGLAQKILGVGLNKTRRNSNWEKRPLSKNQLEYAALDAAVLIHIFCHIRDHPPGVLDGQEKFEWKSHIVSHVDNLRKTKKACKKEGEV